MLTILPIILRVTRIMPVEKKNIVTKVSGMLGLFFTLTRTPGTELISAKIIFDPYISFAFFSPMGKKDCCASLFSVIEVSFTTG